MTGHALQPVIEALWERSGELSSATRGEPREAVEAALAALDSGELRVASPGPDGWHVHDWLKKAVLLSFRLNDSTLMPGAAGAPVWDKVPMKLEGWNENRFGAAGFRAVPGAVVRRSAYIAPGVVLMPCFVNVGAYVGSQHDDRHVGDRRKLRADRRELPHQRRRRHCRRAGAVAGQSGDHRGRLLHRRPFRGRSRASSSSAAACCRWACSSARRPRSSIAKPARCSSGRVPAYSVVVPGTLPGKPSAGRLARARRSSCAVIVKRVDERTRSKTSITEPASRLNPGLHR